MTAEVCKTLRKLTSVKMDWAWNIMHQKIYDKAKTLIKQDTYMKFYDAPKPPYLEMDAWGLPLTGKKWHELWVR